MKNNNFKKSIRYLYNSPSDITNYISYSYLNYYQKFKNRGDYKMIKFQSVLKYILLSAIARNKSGISNSKIIFDSNNNSLNTISFQNYIEKYELKDAEIHYLTISRSKFIFSIALKAITYSLRYRDFNLLFDYIRIKFYIQYLCENSNAKIIHFRNPVWPFVTGLTYLLNLKGIKTYSYTFLLPLPIYNGLYVNNLVLSMKYNEELLSLTKIKYNSKEFVPISVDKNNKSSDFLRLQNNGISLYLSDLTVLNIESLDYRILKAFSKLAYSNSDINFFINTHYNQKEKQIEIVRKYINSSNVVFDNKLERSYGNIGKTKLSFSGLSSIGIEIIDHYEIKNHFILTYPDQFIYYLKKTYLKDNIVNVNKIDGDYELVKLMQVYIDSV